MSDKWLSAMTAVKKAGCFPFRTLVTGEHQTPQGVSKHTTQGKPSELEQILDDHAEYYIRQTMKFFQRTGESPALSKNNEGDIAAKQAIEALVQQREEAAKQAGYMAGVLDGQAATLQDTELTVRLTR